MKPVKLGAVMLFHPLYAIDLIKRDTKAYSRFPSFLLLFAAVVARIVTILTQNYTVSGMELGDVNFLLDVLIILVPFGTWILVNYFMTEILSGESSLGEIMAYSSYALLPYIVTTPVFIALSWAMSEGLMAFYTLGQLLVGAWVVILLFLGVMRANEYGFWKAVGVSLLLVVSMLLLWALLILFFALISQTYMVISEVLYEFNIWRISQ